VVLTPLAISTFLLGAIFESICWKRTSFNDPTVCQVKVTGSKISVLPNSDDMSASLSVVNRARRVLPGPAITLARSSPGPDLKLYTDQARIQKS
jgi:hypothetical protein